MKRLLCLIYLIAFCVNTTLLHAQIAPIEKQITIESTFNGTVYAAKWTIHNDVAPKVTVSNIVTQKVADTSLVSGQKLSPYIDADYTIAMERKVPQLIVQLPTYIRKDGVVEKLVSCVISVEFEKLRTAKAKKVYASNSVLSTGNWYKIATDKKGVYKIDYNTLSTIGINPSTINPQNIRIYGNGGYALSEAVDTSYLDDLAENAIFVSATGTTFGTNDYILFYSNGLNEIKIIDDQKAQHTINPYENQAYYFITVDHGVGKRIQSVNNVAGTPVATYNSYHEYKVLNFDSASLSNLGKVWWGSRMNALNPATLNPSFNFNLGNPLGAVHITAEVANKASNPANFSLRYNNQTIANATLPAIGDLEVFYTYQKMTATVNHTGSSIDIGMRYALSGSTSGSGYIDYLSVFYENALKKYDAQVAFKNAHAQNVPLNAIIQYNIENANNNYTVWNISDVVNPIKMNGQFTGNTLQIKEENTQQQEYIVFENVFYTPIALGKIDNQNLHALDIPDMLIITDPLFKSAADDLANYRRGQGYKVHVVEKNVIFNEFGSGKQDVAAIRNFIKMFYDRANNADEVPKGILFFGAASFDYKNRIANNSNFVPTYQSARSHVKFAAFSSDDFYALLDDYEDFTSNVAINTNLYDVAIGRIPSYSLEQANIAVSKIKLYESPASFGAWKTNVSYVADDIDANGSMNHLKDCDSSNVLFLDSLQNFNLYKIYADAFQKTATASGLRYPLVNKAIKDQVYNGTLLMSYSGHGSPERWADEAILTFDDIKAWDNTYKMPLVFTGTCDFGRYDNPEEYSGGVSLFNKATGGAIALVTTTQLVFASNSTAFNKSFMKNQFLKGANNEYRTIAEVMRLSKNDLTYAGNSFGNNKMFVYLGDPLLHLAIPNNVVKTDAIYQINEDDQKITTDTLKALGKYQIVGSVTDKDDNLLTHFNGKVQVAVYDKRKIIQTINDHPQVTKSYAQQTNIVAKVLVDAVDGKFEATFVVPKDIMIDLDKSKIVYYAYDDAIDATGLDTTIWLGELIANAPEDNEGPIVNAYIDDEKFRDGGVTGSNPMLYVKLYDDNGINVSGSSIGHDLVAILDENLQTPYILNDFYQTYSNEYQRGYVYFPLSNLEEGMHTIRVKAWDTYNNSGEGSVTFEVRNVKDGVINTIYNYPNPFNYNTTFVIQHNQKGEEMDVDISIFSVTGALVQRIQKTLTPKENRTEIEWDGKNTSGTQTHPGVYVYKVTLQTRNGVKATASHKLLKTFD